MLFLLLIALKSFIFQKLDFVKVRDWRKKRAACLRTRVAKKANIIETLKCDALRVTDGSIELRTCFPADVTSDGQTATCCGTAFCKLYGMSSKTKSAYWKIAVLGGEVERAEVEELQSGRNEGRRHQTLLWMKETFHVLCDILPTADYSSKDYHLLKFLRTGKGAGYLSEEDLLEPVHPYESSKARTEV